MIKKRIIHIHSDPKFVAETGKFESSRLENELIFLGKPKEISELEYSGNTIFFPKKKEVISKIINRSRNADLIVINGMDYFNEQIVLRLPKDIKVAWRFFGFELYSRVPQVVFSRLTQDVLNRGIPSQFIITSIKHWLLKVLPSLSSLHRAIKRVDYFLGAFEEEYSLLKTLSFDLPPFIRIPFRFQSSMEGLKFPKFPLIILGNSRSPFNNHLDIIMRMQDISLPEKLSVKLFFSYCEESNYTRAVRREADKLAQIELVEYFLSKYEFREIYQHSAALVINGYRQMALGNIFAAVCSGTKVYLSEKNITFKWLRNLQFKIFSIEYDFYNDLAQSNFYLSSEEARHNLDKLMSLMERYTYEDFQEAIFKG